MSAQIVQTRTFATSEQTSLYVIDPSHAVAQFKVRHLMVAHVRGELGGVTGQVWIDAADLTRSRVVAEIDAAGIDTREPKRDEHLRSADFLDVETYPTITFVSSSVRQRGDKLLVTGALTIRGVTRDVALDVELSGVIADPWGNVKRGVSATARINRQDFGVSWNALMDAGGVVVADMVDITIEAELILQQG